MQINYDYDNCQYNPWLLIKIVILRYRLYNLYEFIFFRNSTEGEVKI